MTMVSMTICQPGLCPKLLGHRNRACSSGFLISAEAPIHPAAQGKPAWLPPSPQATIQSMSSPGDLPGSSSETYLPPASPQRMLPPELGCLQRASESCIPAGRWGKGAQEFVAFWESNQTKRMTTSLSSGSNSLQLTSLDRPGRLQANENSRGPRIKRGWGRRETLLRKQRPPDSSSPSFPSRCELQACKHPPTSSPSLAVGAGARDQFYPHNSGQSCALAHPSITSFINFSLSTGSFQLSKGRRSPIQNKTSFHCAVVLATTPSLSFSTCVLSDPHSEASASASSTPRKLLLQDVSATKPVGHLPSGLRLHFFPALILFLSPPSDSVTFRLSPCSPALSSSFLFSCSGCSPLPTLQAQRVHIMSSPWPVAWPAHQWLRKVRSSAHCGSTVVLLPVQDKTGTES